MSRGPWVWVEPGGWGPRGLPGATPSQLCPCPESTFRVAAGRWPCTGPGRAAAQTVLATSAQAEVPIPVGRAGCSRGKAGGEWDNQQTQVVSPAHLTPRQTALWAVFEHRRVQKDGLSASLQEVWNGYRLIFLFYSKLSGKSDFSLCDKLTWCKW